VKYTDPDGRDFYNFTDKDITVVQENGKGVSVRPGEMYMGAIDGAILEGDKIIKVSSPEGGVIVDVSMENVDGKDTAFLVGKSSTTINNFSDTFKAVRNVFKYKNDLLSGEYKSGTKKHAELESKWAGARQLTGDKIKVRKMTEYDIAHVDLLKEGAKQQIKIRE
jgi:hypothetical protein